MTEKQPINRGEHKVSPPPPQPPEEEHDAKSVDFGHQEDGMEPRPPEDAPEQKADGEAGAEPVQEAAEDQPTETLKDKAIRLAQEIYQATPVPKRYWGLGEAVNDLLAKADKNEKAKIIKDIVDQSGLSADSIRKARRFHEKYMNKKIFERLFAAGPHVSWHLVSNSLRIKPEKFVEMCEEARTATELNNKVINWKKDNPDPRGRKNGDDTAKATIQALEEKLEKALRRVRSTIHTAKTEGASEAVLRALDQLMDDLKL